MCYTITYGCVGESELFFNCVLVESTTHGKSGGFKTLQYKTTLHIKVLVMMRLNHQIKVPYIRPASNENSQCSAHFVESLFGRPKLRNNLELNCQEIISGVKPIQTKHEKIVSYP